MKIDFSKLLIGNGIESLLEGKTENIQLDVIEEDSVENCQIIVSDGSSRNKAILLKDAALLYKKMGSKYCVINIKEYDVQDFGEGKVIIITKMGIKGLETNLENLGVKCEKAQESVSSVKEFESGDPEKRVFREGSYENILKTPQRLSSNEKQKETSIHKNLKNLPMGVFDTLEARISAKTEMKLYKNEKGEGKFFSVTIEDYDKRTMRAVFFNDSAYHFFPLIEKGRLYQMQKGKVKYVDANFNKTGNEIEIIFDQYTSIITEIAGRGRFGEYSGIMVGFETLRPQPLVGQSGFNFCNCRNNKPNFMCKVCSQNFEKRHDEDDYLKVRIKTTFEEVDVKIIDRHVMNLFGINAQSAKFYFTSNPKGFKEKYKKVLNIKRTFVVWMSSDRTPIVFRVLTS